MKSNKVIIGTRGSILALAQAERVKEILYKKYEEMRIKDGFNEINGILKDRPLEIELKVIVTTGDKDLRNFKKIEGLSQKNLFVKEIERAMLKGEIDFAVHSLKDMPQVTPEGLENVCFPLREDNRDVLISRNGEKLEDLPENSVIGTGSTRREAELKNLLLSRKDITVKGIRGNIHTRLKKLGDGEYDAVILAAAGLIRTGMEERITLYFSDDEFMPAPGQGILCIQCRKDDERIKGLLSIIDNEKVRMMCEAEREFSRIFDGGCHTPVGCSSKIEGEKIVIKGMFSHNGKRIVKEVEGNIYDRISLSEKLAEEIKKEIKDFTAVKEYEKKKRGKVYIAGAGCGDENLITLKLKEVISKADCIIYDRLVNRNILQYAQPSAELIYMGKSNTEGGELQKEINDTIASKGKQGLTVLRLKGGDPFVFGRGGEEIERLVSEGIEFEVIPGITSAIAVPAYAGIPVTHRGINTSFHVFTGHLKKDGGELDFETMAKLQGTLVFLMGLSNLEKIAHNLIKYGKDEDTPVAVIKDGTTSRQKTYTGTLKSIYETVRENNVKSPAVIVIGEVVSLREKMKWFENKPLYGENILITRNREKQEEIINNINLSGGQGIKAPFINIAYADYNMPDLTEYGAILFNSANSVIGFMKKIRDVRVLGSVKIGAVGEKTAEELKKYKIVPDFFPKEYTVEKLASESVKFTREGERILFAVSDISPVNTEKYTELYNRKYEKLIVYSTQKVHIGKEKTERYVKDSSILMFLSSSTFESFAENLELNIEEHEENREKLKGKIIASIGPVTTGTIRKYGLEVEIEGERYTEEGLMEKILIWKNRRGR